MSNTPKRHIVPESFNIPGGLNDLGQDMHLAIVGHMESLPTLSAYLLSSKRMSLLIGCGGIMKFIGFPSAVMICPKIFGATTPVSNASIEFLEPLLGLQNEPIFLALSIRHPTLSDFLPPDYIEIMIRNGILPAVLSALSQEQSEEMKALLKGILRMLVNHTGAKLWQGEKTDREIIEVFYNAIAASLNNSSEIVQEYLFALLCRWRNVDSSHRQALSSMETEMPSSFFSTLEELLPDDNKEAVKLSERQQKLMFCIMNLMNIGCLVKETDKERLMKRLPLLKKETWKRRCGLDRCNAYPILSGNIIMHETENTSEELMKMLLDDEENETDVIPSSVNEDEVREIGVLNCLPATPIHFAQPVQMKIQNNSIIHHCFDGRSSCLIGDEMKDGIYRLTFKISYMTDNCLFCGVVDASLGCPPSCDTLASSHKGVEWFCGRTLYNRKGHAVQGVASQFTVNSIITMEVDLRSDEPSKRTLHWYCDGEDIGGFFFNLPPSVRFGITLVRRSDSIEFISLEKCTSLLRGGVVEGTGLRF